MGFLSVLSQAQRWVAERTSPGDAVVDATAGNGVDTLFLARAAGAKGTVFAFDVQETALLRTRERLDAASRTEPPLANVVLLHAGHERMSELIPAPYHGKIRAVMFNLGYLPGADEGLITKPDTTLPALEAALELLSPGGVLTAVLYPGHPGGVEEAQSVERWAAGLSPARAQTVHYRFPQKPSAPYLVAVEKR
ncbi:tRNA (mnm(5)s(2)U34)-methyltransferase [Cohnella candidum]|uniref:SAM-dependent methyltransferase n=1 Tax=Cohnella candidum TaxID=2674991 RepID=A0A3G3K0K7_9BACL|nr:class I SAM-dependent methyltransferase [Cohnella candidum]AYQ73647.1 SAM-dependent methyltransferase [Cohnella candidum]